MQYRRTSVSTCLAIVMAFLALGAGCGTIPPQREVGVGEPTPQGDRTQGSLELSNGAPALTNPSEAPVYAGAVLAGDPKGSVLLDFTEQDYTRAIGQQRLVVLYFYAEWCPLCKEEIVYAQSAFDQLNDPRVIGFRVNFNDTHTDTYERTLARQFGVAYQHTKVFFKDGQRILKSPDSWNRERYLMEIRRAL